MNGSDAVWCLYVKKRMKMKQKKDMLYTKYSCEL